MNLNPEDIEDDIFSVTTEDQKKNDIDLDDDDLFMLPSQRKQMINNKKKTKKVKKRPPKQKHLTIDQLLDSANGFDLDDAFQVNSSDMSKQNSEDAHKNNNKYNENNSKFKENNNKTNENIKPDAQNNPQTINQNSQQNNQPNVVPQQIYINPTVSEIEKIESSLINYISTAVYSIRESFIDCLKDLLDNSKDEQSLIDSFLLSLPSEIDELVMSEIQNVKDILAANTNSFVSTVDIQLEPLQKLFPQKSVKNTGPTIESLHDSVLNEQIKMNEKYNDLLQSVQQENDALSSLRQQRAIYEEQNRIDSPNMMLLIEAESDTKRLEVEKQFIEYRKKRLNKIKQDWKDYHFQSDEQMMDSEGYELLKRLSTLSRKVPQSKHAYVGSSLKSLSQNSLEAYQDIRKLRKQLIQEVKNVCFEMQMFPKAKKKQEKVFHAAPQTVEKALSIKSNKSSCSRRLSNDSIASSNSSESSKASVKSSSRSSRFSKENISESSMLSDIKEQLRQIRQQRTQQTNEANHE
ncbi:hypothetical protein TRFO_13417 [Tritrichomonas foetus]|uniref:Uncharacterized protein n=1 Tax=Tritrichomonas foetus TaxID=1144522 RepID=A0A1J4L2I4_9EUKA|nr:hypothetical protein TRFO_13417 [Tritrichomonas foetus]|eukprot:OHT16101.1 hypothetical protein TRFO_13417 [Tritrichomonas foetus]